MNILFKHNKSRKKKKENSRLNHGTSLLGWLHIQFPTSISYWAYIRMTSIERNTDYIYLVLFVLVLFCWCIANHVSGPCSMFSGGMIMEKKARYPLVLRQTRWKELVHKRKYDLSLHRWITSTLGFQFHFGNCLCPAKTPTPRIPSVLVQWPY